ncbi:hypothetical protein FWK35_00005219 [Aphis craccivora]|uniref:Uncharacterized protein n=1 Tax=Aphis craccivora TaxID=307492 RepID=A0A6G0ZAB2_APHCR|nr:hypothetical protein FWK35_00005219 [Aphis craccivora]
MSYYDLSRFIAISFVVLYPKAEFDQLCHTQHNRQLAVNSPLYDKDCHRRLLYSSSVSSLFTIAVPSTSGCNVVIIFRDENHFDELLYHFRSFKKRRLFSKNAHQAILIKLVKKRDIHILHSGFGVKTLRGVADDVTGVHALMH